MAATATDTYLREAEAVADQIAAEHDLSDKNDALAAIARAWLIGRVEGIRETMEKLA